MGSAVCCESEENVRIMHFVTGSGSHYQIYVADDPRNAQACIVHVERLGDECLSREGIERGGFDVLTSREREILALISKGQTNPQIAEKLCISLSTVKSHLQNMFEKTGVKNRAMLVSKFYDAGR